MYHQSCSWLSCRWAVQCWARSNPSCEPVTHPWQELLMLLLLPHQEWVDEHPCPHQTLRSSSGGQMLSEWKPHHSIMLSIFLAWAKVLHPAETWYQSIGSFVHLPASIPLNLPLNFPSRATILLGALSLSSQPSAPLDPTEPALLNYSYP